MEPYHEDKSHALPSLDLKEDWTQISYTWRVPTGAEAKSPKPAM
jgi:hypothetical protein